MSQAHADLDKATPKNIPTDVGAMLDSLKGGARSCRRKTMRALVKRPAVKI